MDLEVPTTIPYPPFRKDICTLEDEIFSNWDNAGLLDNVELIKINWTSYYIKWQQSGSDPKLLQKAIDYLSSLDSIKTYILISQHDDLIPFPLLNKIPPKTIIFNAGGNIRNKNILSIPLTYTPKNEYVYLVPSKDEWDKMRLASFIGSNTNDIRTYLDMYLLNNPKIRIKLKSWNESVDPICMAEYAESLIDSRFILAPAGYGPTSFRFYEAFLNNRIPVYIFDEKGPYLPYGEFINWQKCCVIIGKDEIQKLPQILESITHEKYCEMLEYYNRFHTDYFTVKGIASYIKNVITVLIQNQCWNAQKIACIANKTAYPDLIIMLKTLELFNLVAPTIYLICDTYVSENIEKLGYTGKIKSRVELDKYSDLDRIMMERTKVIIKHNGIEFPTNMFTEFVLKKMDAMRWALSEDALSTGVFFSDADICYTAALPTIQVNKYKLFVSPHYINHESESKYGLYNVGFLWTNDINILDMWYKETMTSTYFEQKALDDVVEYYKKENRVSFADTNINYGWWRLLEGRKPASELEKEFTQRIPGFLNSGIMVSGKPLLSIHTHFLENKQPLTIVFNKWLIAKWNRYPFYPIILILKILKILYK